MDFASRLPKWCLQQGALQFCCIHGPFLSKPHLLRTTVVNFKTQHPPKQSRNNNEMEPEKRLKRTVIFEGPPFRLHVSFPRCSSGFCEALIKRALQRAHMRGTHKEALRNHSFSLPKAPRLLSFERSHTEGSLDRRPPAYGAVRLPSAGATQ